MDILGMDFSKENSFSHVVLLVLFIFLGSSVLHGNDVRTRISTHLLVLPLSRRDVGRDPGDP